MGNETFDLSTGVGRPPIRCDYITKKTACCGRTAGTPHPLWTAFSTASPPAMSSCRDFCNATSATAAPAHLRARFVFAYGTGANGKGTFINTIARILGDYATIADVGTFIASNTERHPTDLAKLHGARLVVAQETAEGPPMGRGQDQDA